MHIITIITNFIGMKFDKLEDRHTSELFHYHL